MRLLAWNIRAGGGRRVEEIADQIRRWRVHAVALSEFRGTEPSRRLAALLASQGLTHQRTTAAPGVPARNALLVAARWPLAPIRLRRPPEEPGRWLMVRVRAPAPFALGALHAPNYVTGRKYPFFDSVLAIARRWRAGPAIIAGDTNSTVRALDEQKPTTSFPEEHFIQDMEAAGWADGFRHTRGPRRVYSWYSPNAGNGYRLDQAFINGALLPRLRKVSYLWGHPYGHRRRRDALSDHAAVIVEIETGL